MNGSSRLITNDIELSIFVDSYNRGSNRRKISDIKGSFVRAFYLNKEMVGGYSINKSNRLFHLDIIPVNQREQIEILKKAPSFAEVQSLWIKEHVPNILRSRIYCRSVFDAAATRPDFILGGTFKDNYRRTQMRALPMLLYSGEIEVWNKKQIWWVFYGKPINCIVRLPFAVVGGWLDRWRRSHSVIRKIL